MTVVRSSLGIVPHGRRVLTCPLGPIPYTFGPGIADSGEKVVRVVVSRDMGDGSEGCGEDERIKLGIPSPGIFQLRLFLEGRRIL